MLIVHLSGGFGNQLFSYAFGYAMAKKRKDIFAIDTAIQDAPWFFRNPDILEMNICYDKRITYIISRGILDRALWNKIRFRRAIGWSTKEVREGEIKGEATLETYYNATKNDKNVYFRGDWGKACYFEEVQQEIKDMFTFKGELSENGKAIRNEMANCNSVSIHYRLGDYVRLGASPSPDYFIRAMKYINDRVDNPVFFCFSENLMWVKEQFRELPYDIRYVDYDAEKKDIEDFRLLQEAKHQIISNSTYSWWAAYLNNNMDKIVVAPVGKMWKEDFYMPEWIKQPFESINTGREEL